MDPVRKTALVTGLLFLATFITSIPALALYGPVLHNSHYVLGAGHDTQIFTGAFLEVLLCISNIGTAVAIFPVIRRQNEGLAMGYVASRIVESTIIAVGIISLLSVVTLRREFAGSGADPTAFVVAGKALVAIHKWTFLLGPGYCAGIENGLILGYLMYRSGLVPRPLAALGLVAGTLAFGAGTAELFSLFGQTSTAGFIPLIPEFLFELLIGLWLTFRGFRPASVLQAPAEPAAA
jgi:hypothetical protein